MDQLHRNVLLAAISQEENAYKYWQAAKEISAVADWPDSCARLIPKIYLNLSKHPDSDISGLAKGFYRQTWSRNIRLLKSASIFVQVLKARGIDYRIIKGGAICLISGKYGMRRMGDLDWVFHQSSAAEVVVILGEIGFHPRYEFPDSRLSEIWDDQNGNTFDLHFVTQNNKLNIAFEGLHEICSFDTEFRVPSPEALVAIAANHSLLGHSKSDLTQGLADTAFLYDNIKHDKLSSVLCKYGEYQKLKPFFAILTQLSNSEHEFVELKQFINPFESIKNTFNSIFFSLSPSRRYRRRLWNPVDFKVFRNQPLTLLSFAHAIWLRFGALRPLEKFWIRIFGGFMQQIPEIGNFSAILHLSPGKVDNQSSHISARVIVDNELRINFTKPRKAKTDLHLTANLQEPTPRMLFVNGIGYGHFTPRASNSISLPLEIDETKIEISFRDFSYINRPWIGTLEIEMK